MKLRHIVLIALLAAAAMVAQMPKPGQGRDASGTSLTAGTDYPKPALYDTYANIAAATCGSTETGRIGIATDSVYNFARCSGSAWQWLLNGFTVTVPPSSGWTAVNSSTETFSFTGGYGYLQIPSNGSDSLRARVRSVTAPYMVTAQLSAQVANANFGMCGLLARQSSDGKIVAFGIGANNGISIRSYYHASATGSGFNRGNAVAYSRDWIFLRIADNNTNRILSFSIDGINWQTYSTDTRTTDLTADQVGVFCNSANSVVASMLIGSYKVE